MTADSALGKGLSVLALIVEDRGQTALSQLAADLELPRSTLQRIVRVLCEYGMITKVARGRYDVGLLLARASRAAGFQDQLSRIARAPLQRFAERCGVTAHLGILQDDMVTYLVKVPAPQGAVEFTRENGQLEAYCSGIGKLLLAHLPDEARDNYLAGGPFIPLTERTVTDPDELRACLREVRERGYAVDDGEVVDDLRCMAVPVASPSGPCEIGISLSYFDRSEDVDRDHLLTELRDCAAQIAALLYPRAGRRLDTCGQENR